MASTILYKSDFDKHPNAIVDLNSNNISWVQFASKLKAMGVENWGFHLSLLDSSLSGIDPTREDLDDVTILKIQHEAKRNWWYYPREIFRVPPLSGGPWTHLRADRSNIATYWSIFNGFVTYLQKIRQTGKSLQVRSIACGFHLCWATGSNHILFTKTDLRADEIKAYKEIKNNSPSYLYYNTGKDKDNQQDFTTLCHDNRTYSYIPAGDPEAADKVGRGKSPTLITPDEVPFLTYARISIGALIGATAASFPEAAAAGKFHGILYTTTAGDLSTKDGMFVYEKIKMNGMFFSEILYDAKDREDAMAIIFANSPCEPVPHITISFNHLQLGYTDEWLREQIGRNPGSIEKKKQDQLNIWTFGGQRNPIEEKYLSVIRKSVRDSYHTELMNRYYAIRCHRPLDYIKGRKVVLGLDMSEAIGRDAITGVGVDVETLETIIAFSIRETNLHHFGTFFAHFLAAFPNITVIPEAKSSWTGGIRDQLLIEMPLLGLDIGRRIYSTVVQNAKTDEKSQKDYRAYISGAPSERKYYPYRTQIGFMTTASSRETLTRDVLINVTKEIPNLMIDPMLVDELCTLVEKDGRIDHAASGNDDHVISLCLAHWLLRYGRNLEHYGIDPRLVMSGVKKAVVEDPAILRTREKQLRLQKDISTLVDRIERSTSSMEIAYLEARLKVLRGEVVDVDDPTKLPSSLAVRADKEAAITRERRATQPGMFSSLFNRK